jgi:hypothetical protein
VHRVIALLQRWLLSTHQGAIGLQHLDDYLDEFTFRFNWRTSKSRGKLFYRLAQQAMQVDPVPFAILVNPTSCSIQWRQMNSPIHQEMICGLSAPHELSIRFIFFPADRQFDPEALRNYSNVAT